MVKLDTKVKNQFNPLFSIHPQIQNEHYVCPIYKWAIFVLIKAAQGFSLPARGTWRRTPVRRSPASFQAEGSNPAENAEQGKKGHLWMETI